MATQLLPDQKIDGYDEKNCEILDVHNASKEPRIRSALERFLDSFFHPANIKWMLIVGASIVLGSSLMLVTKQWSDWPAAVKFLAMLGYTAGIWVFAEFGDRRLGLKATGNVLRGLSLLLMPVLMLALSWVGTQPSSTGLPITLEVVSLFLPAMALLVVSSRKILAHFLRGHQLTFLVCYLLLAIAGSLPRAEAPWMALVYMATFWSILTIGVIKVNRHVFFLAEEHRLPRVFGFFPIILLGAQFLMLCSTKALFVSPPHWFGLVTVMLAATILGTTRSIASVFRERTGDLVRPLPWSIALPLFIGVLLTFVGVSISFSSFIAVVPTAVVATFLMFVVAYDTRHWGFTALALVLLTIAYQFSPVLIAQWIEPLKAAAASAVHEKKLPLAFYGITYFPLIAILTCVSCWLVKIQRKDISGPIQIYITCLSILLWCSSLFNIKAALVVAAINCVAFLAFAIAFRDRRYIIGALGAVVLVAATLFPFVNSMVGTEFGINFVAISLITVALLLYVTKFVDTAILRIPLPESGGTLLFADREGRPIAVANQLGLAMLAAIGLLRFALESSTAVNLLDLSSLSLDLLLFASFSLITFRHQHYIAGLAATLLPMASAFSYARYLHWSFAEIADTASIIAPSVSLLGLMAVRWTTVGNNSIVLRRQFGLDLSRLWVAKSNTPPIGITHSLVSWFRCHTIVLTDVGTFVSVMLGLLVYAPHTLMSNILWEDAIGIKQSSIFIAVWLVACTVLLRNRWAAIALAVIAPPYAAATVVSFAPDLLSAQWAPVFWVSVASLLCTLCHFYARSEFAVACFISRIWLCAISMIGLVYLSVPIRVAVVISMTTLLIVRDNIQIRGERMFVAILCNIHALLLIANLAGAEGWVFQYYAYPELATIASALLPALALSMLVSDTLLCKISVKGAEWWSANLRLLAILFFVLVCMGPMAPTVAQGLVFSAIAIAIVCEFLAATRNQSQHRAWSTVATIGLAGVWAWDQGWLDFASGSSQLILVVTAAICLWLSGVVRSHPRFNSFVNPLTVIGLLLPSVVASLAIGLEIDAKLPWFGEAARTASHSLNYLALLSAAAIYFFHGLKSGKNRFFVLAAAILNVGLALLWFNNGLMDPQFYCVPVGLSILWIVELLKKELPYKTQDPLRYAGALVILVSPVYGIMGSGWVHLFSLMVLSVLVILLAIGLRIRVLMYTGTAFLLADLTGMLIRSSMENTNLLWAGGVGLGGAVIALAALCENHREKVLAKIRMVSAELATWN